MNAFVRKAGMLLARVCSVVFWRSFRYPQPIKGRYDIAGNQLEKLKWAYKCWVRQLETAEPNSGIEEHFAGQTLDFHAPAGFVKESSMRLSAGGDIMAVDALCYESTQHLFDGIRDFYFDADLVCANLESTVYAGAPEGRNQLPNRPARMNAGEKMLERLAGIDYFSTANNHCFDYGEEGLLSTLDALRRKNLLYSGTNRSPEEQEDVLIVEKNGIRLAMIAYTFDLNGNQPDKPHWVNEVRFNDEEVNLSLVRRHIAAARAQGADLIVASCHWGWEFEMYPHKSIIALAHRLADEGIDVILGAHPHVAQPVERYLASRGGVPFPCLIVYSLGDFVSYHPLSKNAKLTFVVRLRIEKGSLGGESAAFIGGVEVLPVYILAARQAKGGFDCRLLPFEEVLGAPAAYGLSEAEKKDLPRLNERIWRGILMPDARLTAPR